MPAAAGIADTITLPTTQDVMGLWRRTKFAAIAPLVDLTIRLAPKLFSAAQPPAFLNFAGPGDYIAIGDGIVRFLEEHAGLRRGQTLVEVGCGIGRIATALARRHGDEIRYTGFDVVRYGITWCREKISRVDPEYRFHHADIHNDFYNPTGRLAASSYVFPVADAACDLCFHASVFTHMPAGEVAHYLAETRRVLKPGGLSLFSCFLRDERHDAVRSKSQGLVDFSIRQDGVWIHDLAEPYLAVAYEPADMKRMIASAGLRLEKIITGHWNSTNPADAQQYQDFILVRLS